MQTLCSLLIGLLLHAIAAVEGGAVPDSVSVSDGPHGDRHAELQQHTEQYASLDAATQQQWIRDLLGRLDRAEGIVLPPDEAAAERARHAALLRRVARGHTTSSAEFFELLDRTDRREQQAAEQLARRFRIGVYNSFRLDRDEYARRRAIGVQVLADWQAAGSPLHRQDLLIDWFEAAVRSSTPGSIGPLPEVPDFERPAEVFSPLVAISPIEQTEQPRSVPGSPAWPAIAEEPPVPEEPTPVIVPLPEPQPPPLADSPSNDDLPSVGSTLPPVPAPPNVSVPSVGPVPPGPAVADLLPFDLTALPEPPSPEPPRPGVPGGPAGSLPVHASPRLPPADPQPGVNITELAARIAGSNLALQRFEAELDEGLPWNARRLEPLVDRLEVLAIRQGDLALFRELVPAGQRRRVGPLESPRAAITRLTARIAEARSRADGPDFPGTEAQRRSELRQLDALSRRLAEMQGDEG